MKDKLGIYSLTIKFQPNYLSSYSPILKIFKEVCLIYITVIFKNMKKFKNWLENHGFFDEDHQFFKGFEITKTSNSLILIFFSKIEIANSLILEYLKNQNQWFFKNSKNHTTQKYTYLISNQSLILDPIS